MQYKTLVSLAVLTIGISFFACNGSKKEQGAKSQYGDSSSTVAVNKDSSQAKEQQNNSQETVIFNTHTLKYHCPSCKWAIKCTKNCISVSLEEAIKSGGIPCKVCGGRCR